MKNYRLFWLLTGCWAAWQMSLAARDSEGRLDLVITPNNGVPVILAPEQSFTVTSTSESTLSLEKDNQSWPLSAHWTIMPGAKHQATCKAATPLPAGCYALKAKNSTGQDVNKRSVYVLESFPSAYPIAHITDTHLGSMRHPRAASDIFREIIAAVNNTEAQLVVITGDLTENGEPEQFRSFIEILDGCQLPTYVTPGNHDRSGKHYESFFGPMPYSFLFGEDGFLAFDTKDFIIADGLTQQDGLLYYHRRLLRPVRWCTGITHRYDLTMGLRAQITLFVDDPLDCLLYGHYHRETTQGDGIPWGNTAIILTPAAIDGQFRLVEISADKIQPLETITAATVSHADAHVNGT